MNSRPAKQPERQRASNPVVSALTARCEELEEALERIVGAKTGMDRTPGTGGDFIAAQRRLFRVISEARQTLTSNRPEETQPANHPRSEERCPSCGSFESDECAGGRFVHKHGLRGSWHPAPCCPDPFHRPDRKEGDAEALATLRAACAGGGFESAEQTERVSRWALSEIESLRGEVLAAARVVQRVRDWAETVKANEDKPVGENTDARMVAGVRWAADRVLGSLNAVDHPNQAEAEPKPIIQSSSSPDSCPTCGSDDPDIHRLSDAFDSPADYPEDRLCPDEFHTPDPGRQGDARPWCCPEPRCRPLHQLTDIGGEDLSAPAPGDSFSCFGRAPGVDFTYDGSNHSNDTRSCHYTPLKGVVAYQENVDDWTALGRAYATAAKKANDQQEAQNER